MRLFSKRATPQQVAELMSLLDEKIAEAQASGLTRTTDDMESGYMAIDQSHYIDWSCWANPQSTVISLHDDGEETMVLGYAPGKGPYLIDKLGRLDDFLDDLGLRAYVTQKEITQLIEAMKPMVAIPEDPRFAR